MQEYRFSDDGIRTLRARFVGMGVVLGLVVVAASVAATGRRRSTTTADLITVAIVLTVLMSVMTVTVWLTLGVQIGRWRAFRIRLDADGIESDAGPGQRVRIGRGELASVQEAQGGLLLKAGRDRREISVPGVLDATDYFAIREVVAQWADLRSVSPTSRYAGLLALIPGVVGLGLIFLSSDTALVGVGAALLAGLDLFLYIKQRGKPGVDPAQTRSLVFACLIAVIAGIGRAAALGGFR